MTSKATKLRRSIIDKKYRLFYSTGKCYYCGDLADTIDHAPAINQVYAWGEDRFRKRGIPLLKVSCCSECNNLLGARSYHSLAKRSRYLYRTLVKRYKKLVHMPTWDEDEVDELDHGLGEYISDSQLLKSWIERRLQYMEEVHYDCV